MSEELRVVRKIEVEAARLQLIPHTPPPRVDGRLVLWREPESARAASFRVLRHRLGVAADPRVVVVSSAQPREGRTTCAANLALALAEEARSRVLLVEANLRSSVLAAMFGCKPAHCFGDQLAAHRNAPETPWQVVQVLDSLHLLPAKPQEKPRSLTDGASFRRAIESFRRAGYDYVIIDTPPVLGSADVNLVEDSADGVLLTTWSGRSSSRALRRTVEQLSPAKILGLVLMNAT